MVGQMKQFVGPPLGVLGCDIMLEKDARVRYHNILLTVRKLISMEKSLEI